jgi:hypothetical protein
MFLALISKPSEAGFTPCHGISVFGLKAAAILNRKKQFLLTLS